MHFVRSARVVSGGVNERGVRGSSKLQESFGVALPPPALLFHDQECVGHRSEWDGIESDQAKNGIFVLEGNCNDHFNCLDIPGAVVPAGPGFPRLLHSLGRGWTPNQVPGAG